MSPYMAPRSQSAASIPSITSSVGSPKRKVGRTINGNVTVTGVASSKSLADSISDSSVGSSEFADFLLDHPVKSRFTPGNFHKASNIIRAIKNSSPEKAEQRRPVFWSDEERILTYELAIAILKHSELLRDALEKCQFYEKFPKLRKVQPGKNQDASSEDKGQGQRSAGEYPQEEEELLIILYDLIERDFRTSPEDANLPACFAKLQRAVLSVKTKLMAHIARIRIKHEVMRSTKSNLGSGQGKVRSLDKLLPPNLRQRSSQNIDKNPLYFWVNLKKTSVNYVRSELFGEHGFRETSFEDDTLIEQTNFFNVSKIHPDLIRMHSSKLNLISGLSLLRDGFIVVQDKSAALPVYTLAKALYYKEALNHGGCGLENLNPFPNKNKVKFTNPDPSLFGLIGLGHEAELSTSKVSPREHEWYQGILDGPSKNFSRPESVVITHCGAGRSAAHLAILLSQAVPHYLSKSTNMMTTGSNLAKAIKSKFYYRPALTVVVFGTPKSKFDEIHKYVKRTLGVTNIRLYSDDFLQVSAKDPRVKGCGAVLVNPPSSGSALKDPVSYICSEGGDEQILSNFLKLGSKVRSQSRGESRGSVVDEDSSYSSESQPQSKYLSHALRIPNVKLVLYTTCSNLHCENEEVVRSSLTQVRTKEEQRKCQLYASIVLQGSPGLKESTTSVPSSKGCFKEVSYELVNLGSLMEGYELEEVMTQEFVDMQPTSACSGVFMALIRRRERQIILAKNPVRQFVASQVLSDEQDLDEFLTSSRMSTCQRSFSSSMLATTSNISISEKDLANFLWRKLNKSSLPQTPTRGQGLGQRPASFSASEVDEPPSIPIFQAAAKKRSSKRSIIRRVSTPTHSSILRQTEKYELQQQLGQGSQVASSPVLVIDTCSHHHHGHGLKAKSRSSNATPRPGTASSTVTITPLKGQSTKSAPVSARGSKSMQIKVKSCPLHNNPHGHGGHAGGHVCVCARHAKKFPEMLKNL